MLFFVAHSRATACGRGEMNDERGGPRHGSRAGGGGGLFSLERSWRLAGRGGVFGDGAAWQPVRRAQGDCGATRSEHTSELQSLMRISYAVFCLKKKKTKSNKKQTI